MSSKFLVLPENIDVLKNTIIKNKPNLNDSNTLKLIQKCLNQYISETELIEIKKLFGISPSCRFRIINITRYNKCYPVFQFRLPKMIEDMCINIVQVDLKINTSL